MDRCQRCGANALDLHGKCRNCGWQAPVNAFDDDLPSLGETRAADTALQPAPGRFVRASGYQDPSSGATAAAGSRAQRSTPVSGSAPRYCGVCGARITGSEAFCGQCGSPVSSSPGGAGSQPGGGRYQVGPEDWRAEDGDAYTEALPEPPAMAGGRNPYLHDPYARPYPAGYSAAQSSTPGLSRSSRITIGAIFLGASVLIAIVTITLAVIWLSA